MIITMYGIVVFQLVERIAIVDKSSTEVFEEMRSYVRVFIQCNSDKA